MVVRSVDYRTVLLYARCTGITLFAGRCDTVLVPSTGSSKGVRTYILVAPYVAHSTRDSLIPIHPSPFLFESSLSIERE